MTLEEGGGGVVGIQNIILNKERSETCGVVSTPAAVTNESKFHGVVSAGQLPPPRGKGGQIRGKRGYPYAVESVVGDDLRG